MARADATLYRLKCLVMWLISDGVRMINNKKWLVASESTLGKWYKVKIVKKGIICECKHSKMRGGAMCKHARKVEKKLLAMHDKHITKTKQVVIKKPKLCCPRCHSAKFIKNGKRYNKKRKKVPAVPVQELPQVVLGG